MPRGADPLMAELVVDFITSLDGYASAEGWPGWWGVEGPEYLTWLGDRPDRDHTLLMGANYVTIAPSLYKRMNYDPMKDLAPVTLVGSVPSVLVVNNAVPAKTVAELIALARSKPNEFAFATPGLGTSTHLTTELFKQRTGTEMRHVPYRANPLAMNDVIGGQIQVFFDLLTTGAPQVRVRVRKYP